MNVFLLEHFISYCSFLFRFVYWKRFRFLFMFSIACLLLPKEHSISLGIHKIKVVAMQKEMENTSHLAGRCFWMIFQEKKNYPMYCYIFAVYSINFKLHYFLGLYFGFGFGFHDVHIKWFCHIVCKGKMNNEQCVHR